MYTPSWSDMEAFVMRSVDVLLPSTNSKEPGLGIDALKSVIVSLWGNGAGEPLNIQVMVGMGLPRKVQEISMESPSVTETKASFEMKNGATVKRKWT